MTRWTSTSSFTLTRPRLSRDVVQYIARRPISCNCVRKTRQLPYRSHSGAASLCTELSVLSLTWTPYSKRDIRLRASSNPTGTSTPSTASWITFNKRSSWVPDRCNMPLAALRASRFRPNKFLDLTPVKSLLSQERRLKPRISAKRRVTIIFRSPKSARRAQIIRLWTASVELAAANRSKERVMSAILVLSAKMVIAVLRVQEWNESRNRKRIQQRLTLTESLKKR